MIWYRSDDLLFLKFSRALVTTGRGCTVGLGSTGGRRVITPS